MSPIKLNGAVVAGIAAVLSASAAWAGCNCGVPPAPAAMGQFQGGAPVQGGAPASQYQPDPQYQNQMAPPYQMMSPGGYAGSASGVGGPQWAPGGYEARTGSPVYYHDPAGGQYQVSGNPYQDHFGPGFHRSSLYGHYRFPYYNYRAPWYFPGRAVYNRDTNLAW